MVIKQVFQVGTRRPATSRSATGNAEVQAALALLAIQPGPSDIANHAARITRAAVSDSGNWCGGKARGCRRAGPERVGALIPGAFRTQAREAVGDWIYDRAACRGSGVGINMSCASAASRL